jgi:hypothetical protein
MPDPFNPIVNVNPSPKARFIGVKAYIDTHRELIQRPDLQRGLDSALAQYAWELSAVDMDGNKAAQHQFKLVGAHEFIRTLKSLAEQPIVPKIVKGEREMDHGA